MSACPRLVRSASKEGRDARSVRFGRSSLAVDHHAETDKVLVLESNAAFRLDGVGYGGLGNLRDVGLQPPADWWLRSEVWTWRRICSTYPFRRQAWLKVKE
ncbi:hypothetical protein [Stigmatella aurantiaca]|uniref:hypothetical protein n=1 Tax=Stigmatella aurantiaca TaxID=41 RepID=UPI001E60BE4F|nr:hypothetical protein [Stigmatella aurantiaca]